MDPIQKLSSLIFLSPESDYWSDGEKLARVLINECSSNFSGKAKHREVPEPVNYWVKVEQILLSEISLCEMNSFAYSSRLVIFRDALQYIHDRMAESNYCGSFAASTQSKHTVETNHRKFRNWGEHVVSTPRDETMAREIPKKTPHRSDEGFSDDLWAAMGMKPEWKKIGKTKPKPSLPLTTYQPFDSLSDKREMCQNFIRRDQLLLNELNDWLEYNADKPGLLQCFILLGS